MLEFRNLLEQVEKMGGQVKDIDYGLVDFPGCVQGQPVLLCWRKGEPKIAWWHGVDEGFIGRKPLPSTSES
ncbi:MAG: DUF2203 domain-containing protein [Alicyclobacillaceae bacterium]|nr:DUF2203 domain-containing protein [Alicyclobacillaceae bacterium]